MENVNTKEHKSFAQIIDKYYTIIYLVLFAVIIFSCFFNIWSAPIQDWDEARHGVNAYEMLRENNYIANYYNGNIDYWNLKPPISYWFIILGYKIFGYNAFGLRFFSALSFVLICVIISLYLMKHYGKLTSLISLVVLLSNYYLFIFHCIRSGDADAIFLLFYTIAIVSLLKINDNPNWIFLSGIMFGLCFLTKSWHAFILVPTVFFYLLFSKGFKKIKWWRLVLFFIMSMLPIAIWAICRYQFDGLEFFKQMYEYDLMSRSSSSLDGHTGTIFFYFLLLFINASMIISLIAITISTVKSIKNHEKMSDLAKLCLISFLSTFIIYSLAKTKINWYCFPCTIPLALYTPTIFEKLKLNVDGTSKIPHSLKNAIPITVTVLLGICCLVSFVFPFTIKSDNKTQNFINSINNVKSVELYIQDEDKTSWSQSDLLTAELKLDAYCKNGGYNNFTSNTSSYLIISNDTNLDLTPYKLVFKNNYYSLYSHKK